MNNPNTISRTPDGAFAGDIRVKQLFDVASSTVTYVGRAALGTATSAAAWTIKKVTTSVTGNPESVLWTSTTAVWDNRATESYT